MHALVLLLLVANSVLASKTDQAPVLHGIFHSATDDTHIYYGFLDLDIGELNVLSILDIKDVGNPKYRKYSAVPLTYDPNNDVVYMAATTDQNQTVLSYFNASSGVLLGKFNSIPNSIISLQFDIFQKQLFAHMQTNVEDSSVVVEINTNDGSIKRTLAKIDNADPTDVSSYCPICRKYFLMVRQNQQSVYVGIDSTDVGGISWQSPVNFEPLSMRFDYKTFTMYTAYINTTQQFTSTIGILNRTIGGIDQVVGTISTNSSLFVTSLSAFDIAEKVYYSSDIFVYPYSLGISWTSVNDTKVNTISLSALTYTPYAWFVKQFIH